MSKITVIPVTKNSEPLNFDMEEGDKRIEAIENIKYLMELLDDKEDGFEMGLLKTMKINLEAKMKGKGE